MRSNQRWLFEKRAPSTYAIKSNATGHALESSLGDKVYGSCFRVGVTSAHYGDNQLWILEEKGTDIFWLRNKATSNILEALPRHNERVHNVCYRVVVCPTNQGNNQLWKLENFDQHRYRKKIFLDYLLFSS